MTPANLKNIKKEKKKHMRGLKYYIPYWFHNGELLLLSSTDCKEWELSGLSLSKG